MSEKLLTSVTTIVIVLVVVSVYPPFVLSCYPNYNMQFSLDDDLIQQYLRCTEAEVRDQFTQLCVLKCQDDELYFEKTKRCHKFSDDKGEQGPCGENMFLMRKHEHPHLGKCQCRDNETRALVYHKKTNKCHFVFSQGPCRSGKWVNLTNDGVPRCVINPCAEVQRQDPTAEYVYFGQQCVKLGAPCDKNGRVKFASGDVSPQCQRSGLIFQPRAFGAISTSCPENTYPSYGGRCQPILDTDF